MNSNSLTLRQKHESGALSLYDKSATGLVLQGSPIDAADIQNARSLFRSIIDNLKPTDEEYSAYQKLIRRKTPKGVAGIWIVDDLIDSAHEQTAIQAVFHYITTHFFLEGGDLSQTGWAMDMERWGDTTAIGSLIRFQMATQSPGSRGAGIASAGHEHASAMRATHELLDEPEANFKNGLPPSLQPLIADLRSYLRAREVEEGRIEGYTEATYVSSKSVDYFLTFLKSLPIDKPMSHEERDWFKAFLHAMQTFRGEFDVRLLGNVAEMYSHLGDDDELKSEIFDIFAYRMQGIKLWREAVGSGPLPRQVVIEPMPVYTSGILKIVRSPNFTPSLSQLSHFIKSGVTLEKYLSRNCPNREQVVADRQYIAMHFQYLLAKELYELGALKENDVPQLPSHRSQPLLPSASPDMLQALQSIRMYEPLPLLTSALHRQATRLNVNSKYANIAQDDQIRRILLYIQILDVCDFDSELITKAVRYLTERPDTAAIGKQQGYNENSSDREFREGCFYQTDVNVHSWPATYTKLLVKRFVKSNDIEAIYTLKFIYLQGDDKIRKSITNELGGGYLDHPGDIGGDDTKELLDKDPVKKQQVETILFG